MARREGGMGELCGVSRSGRGGEAWPQLSPAKEHTSGTPIQETKQWARGEVTMCSGPLHFFSSISGALFHPAVLSLPLLLFLAYSVGTSVSVLALPSFPSSSLLPLPPSTERPQRGILPSLQ